MILIFNFYRFLLFNHSFFYLTIHVFTFSSILFRYDAVSRGSKPPGLERLRGILPTAQRRGRLTIWIVENKATTEPTTTRQGQCDREMSVTLSIANSGIEMDVSVYFYLSCSRDWYLYHILCSGVTIIDNIITNKYVALMLHVYLCCIYFHFHH